MPKSKSEVSVWKSTDEYYDFVREYNVFGSEAIKLKQQQAKQSIIPEPKIRR